MIPHERRGGGRFSSSGGRGTGGRDGIGGFDGGFCVGGFDLGFLDGLLHSSLGDFGRLRQILHPSLQVSSRSLHPSFQVILSHLLLLLSGSDGDSVLLLL